MDRRSFIEGLFATPIVCAPPGIITERQAPPLAAALSPRMVFHCGAGVSGATINGAAPVLYQWFYAITPSGKLTYHAFSDDGDPTKGKWDKGSGNPIGTGWGSVLHAVGSNDIVYAVSADGYLRWYKYIGSGAADPSGSSKSWLRNSGNRIGVGWGGVKRVLASQPAADGSPSCLYTIEQNGDLRWFSYAGAGEDDPTASRGWRPNTGNVIGNGWQNVRHAHGSGRVIFAVDEDGYLRWYSYVGKGESDRSARTGWAPNTGNIIGNGWGDARHIFGGLTDYGRRGHTIFVVTQAGELKWYRYYGKGEQDPSGRAGWDPRSGTTIATNW